VRDIHVVAERLQALRLRAVQPVRDGPGFLRHRPQPLDQGRGHDPLQNDVAVLTVEGRVRGGDLGFAWVAPKSRLHVRQKEIRE
jgi:hypothetical protein